MTNKKNKNIFCLVGIACLLGILAYLPMSVVAATTSVDQTSKIVSPNTSHIKGEVTLIADISHYTPPSVDPLKIVWRVGDPRSDPSSRKNIANGTCEPFSTNCFVGVWNTYPTPDLVSKYPYLLQEPNAFVQDGNYYMRFTINSSISSEPIPINVDNTAPTLTLSPYPTSLTNKPIVVTASTNEGSVNAASHTFASNGSFTFAAVDAAGNTINKIVTIDNIDTSPPVVSLNGPSVITLNAGGIYTELGAVWTDNIEGTGIVDHIVGTVNVAVPGIYTLVYTKQDAAGNMGMATRTVIINAQPIIPIPPLATCLTGDASASKTGCVYSTPTIVQHESSGETSNDLIYQNEYDHAYSFALEHGITTKPSLQEADMDGKLTRSQMAKMIANYAINVLHYIPTTTLVCSFDDLSGQTAEMQSYIIQACQLGLMGQHIKSFYPNGKVTRAELGTVLSRMLYHTPDSTTRDPYYLVHLNLLKSKGIISVINPNLFELRSYLMLMLMRAAK